MITVLVMHLVIEAVIFAGLVLDEIRALIWPELAATLHLDSHNDTETSSTISDSEFETALSTLTCDDEASHENSTTHSVVSFCFSDTLFKK